MFPRDFRGAVLFVAIGIGWAVLGLVAWFTVSFLGWLGLAILGLLIALIATHAELGEDAPSLYVRNAAHETRRGAAEQAVSRRAERSDFQRWSGAVRAVGIALAVVGAVMFVRHQL
jgi:hypothetical protein